MKTRTVLQTGGALAAIALIAAVSGLAVEDTNANYNFDFGDARDQTAACLAGADDMTMEDVILAVEWLDTFGVALPDNEVSLNASLVNDGLFSTPEVSCNAVDATKRILDLDIDHTLVDETFDQSI